MEPPSYPPPPPDAAPAPISDEERHWAMGAHVASFAAAYVALGLVAPLVVMLAKGDRSAYIRKHAVESLNFQICTLIYVIVMIALCFVLIGFVLLPLYGIFYLIAVIMGTVAASKGRDFRYPITIRFVS